MGYAMRCPQAHEQQKEFSSFSWAHEPCNNAAVLALFEGKDADTPYDKDSKTRNSETRPSRCPAYHHNEEKTEQQISPSAITASAKRRIFVLSRGSG